MKIKILQLISLALLSFTVSTGAIAAFVPYTDPIWVFHNPPTTCGEENPAWSHSVSEPDPNSKYLWCIRTYNDDGHTQNVGPVAMAKPQCTTGIMYQHPMAAVPSCYEPRYKIVGNSGCDGDLCGKPESCAVAGNPINTISGNKIQTEFDIRRTKTNGLHFTRYYNSFLNTDTQLGLQWQHNYSSSLVIDDEFNTRAPEKESFSSREFDSESEACLSGFNDIKSRLTLPSGNITGKYTPAETEIDDSLVYMDGTPEEDKKVYNLASSSCIYSVNGKPWQKFKIVKVHPLGEAYAEIASENITTSSDHVRARVYSGTGRIYEFTHHTVGGTNGQQVYWISKQPGVRFSRVADGYELRRRDGRREIFNEDGLLTKIIFINEDTHSLRYENDQLAAVSDQYGRSITFGYNNTGLLEQVTDPDGQHIFYTYTAAQQLESVIYPDSTPGDQSDNPRRQYHYEDSRDNKRMTGITNEDNVRYVSWSYGNDGRAITSESLQAGKSATVEYSGNTAIITNELNKKTVYHFDFINGVSKVVRIEGVPTSSCGAADSYYTYDDNGFLESKTNSRGVVTQYEHNNRGLETKRVNAAGTPYEQTVLTDWDPELPLPLEITEPHRITTFKYTDGRLTERSTRSTTAQ